jgi:regulator of extracellular matrix RemA (YlzA/DUF370 family)
MAKSQIRVNAETVLAAYGVSPRTMVFTDKRKHSHRVKFSAVQPDAATVAKLRAAFAAQYPQQQTKVVQSTAHYRSKYDGIAFTVFNG